MTPRGLRVAARTVAKMVEKVARLYEQGATASRLDRYLHHWGQWVRAGLGDRLVPGPSDEGCGLTYLESMGDNHNVAAYWIRYPLEMPKSDSSLPTADTQAPGKKPWVFPVLIVIAGGDADTKAPVASEYGFVGAVPS